MDSINNHLFYFFWLGVCIASSAEVPVQIRGLIYAIFCIFYLLMQY